MLAKVTQAQETLFPASAGVILRGVYEEQFCYAVPRIRGGDPRSREQAALISLCSPHPRG